MQISNPVRTYIVLVSFLLSNRLFFCINTQYKLDINRESKYTKDEEYYRNVLGLSSNFKVEDIKRRYRELVAKYHPDKVNHLGEKLKEMAEREMKEINEAYEYFKKKYNFK